MIRITKEILLRIIIFKEKILTLQFTIQGKTMNTCSTVAVYEEAVE
jgi:hypothetical protein